MNQPEASDDNRGKFADELADRILEHLDAVPEADDAQRRKLVSSIIFETLNG